MTKRKSGAPDQYSSDVLSDEESNTDKGNTENPQTMRIEAQPESIKGGQLRDYQLEGLNWLYKLY